MRREVERMMRLRLISIIFGVLLCIVLAVIVGFVVFMNTGDYSGINGDFGKIEGTQKAETVKYDLPEFNKVAFFSELYRSERTLFRQAVPNLKIINSNKYCVEVNANKDLLDKLEVTVVDTTLCVTFKPDLYNDIERNNKVYKGLFVDCDTFDVTIYAPVASFHTSAEIELDYEAPKTDNLWVVVSGEIIKGKIYHVDSQSASFSFNGSSDVEIQGKVSKGSQIVARHNSRVDATELSTPSLAMRTTAQVFGLSIIKYADGREFPVFDAGVILSVIFILSTVVFAFLFILYRVKFFRQKDKIDKYVEEQKQLEKYLKI